MAQSGPGTVEIFEDFIGLEDPVALTAVPRALGPFMVVGQGVAEADAGAPGLDSDGLSGVVRLTTTNETEHTTALQTHSAYDVALMGTIVAEARVRFADLDTKEAFMGFTDINIASDVPSLETDLLSAVTATLTPVASDYVGFYLSAELTDDEDWHGVYNGGTTTGVTASGNVDLSDDAVAGEWQVLRIEIDNNGTARWYVDGDLKQTTAGAVSTTVDLKFMIGVEAKSAAIESMDVDYISITANRDWTA
tara:strand:+ start:2176 stop:2925 length:750 start_codon:yes stop_codon:yes gene_type:complete